MDECRLRSVGRTSKGFCTLQNQAISLTHSTENLTVQSPKCSPSHPHACMLPLPSYLHTCIHHAILQSFVPTFMHSYTNSFSHAYIHTYIHTCIHTYIHSYIRTEKQRQHMILYYMVAFCNISYCNPCVHYILLKYTVNNINTLLYSFALYCTVLHNAALSNHILVQYRISSYIVFPYTSSILHVNLN